MASKLLFLPNSLFSRPALAAERPRFSRRKNASPTVASTNAKPFPQDSPMPLCNHREKEPMWAPCYANRSNQLSSSVAVRSSLSYPIISPQDQWGMWTALFSVGAFGIWSEKTKIGSALSGALVSVLVALAASNLGIIACEAPVYKVVTGFLLPLAVPLLLYRADMRQVIKSTGKLLFAFLLGSVATTIGTVVAFSTFPKCDMLLNNLCESWNSSIQNFRDKNILTMCEGIRMYLMRRMQQNRDKMKTHPFKICPKILKI